MTTHPKVSHRTIEALVKVITGDRIGPDQSIAPYRTGRKLDEFFTEDLGLQLPSSLQPDSRPKRTAAWLKALIGTPDLRRVIEASVRPGDYEGSDLSVEAAVAYLNQFLAHDDLQLVRAGKRFSLVPLGTSVEVPQTPILSTDYVRELSEKTDGRLSTGDMEGAITAARTMLEAVLVELEERLTGSRGDHKGDLPKQFKAVAKQLRIDDERTDLDDNFKQVVRGLVQVVNGLAPIRNKMSDGHARERKPQEHHARVVVNAAKTIATFLVDSYLAQRERGLLSSAGKPK
jgi:hypothetical protein